MKSKPFSLAVCLALIAVNSCAPADRDQSEARGASRPSSGFEVGQPFPTLAFPGLEDGAPKSIADFRGKRVILHVFASW